MANLPMIFDNITAFPTFVGILQAGKTMYGAMVIEGITYFVQMDEAGVITAVGAGGSASSIFVKVATFGDLPAVGKNYLLYVAQDTKQTYEWDLDTAKYEPLDVQSSFKWTEGNSPFSLTTDMLTGQNPFLIINPDQSTGIATLNLPSAADMTAAFPSADAMHRVMFTVWSLGHVRVVSPDADGMVAEFVKDATFEHGGNFSMYAETNKDWRDTDTNHVEGYWRLTSGTMATDKVTHGGMAVYSGDIDPNTAVNLIGERLYTTHAYLKTFLPDGRATIIEPTINAEDFTFVVDSQTKLDYLISSATANEKKKVLIKALPALAHYTITTTASGTAGTPKVIYQMEAGQQIFASHHTVINVVSNFNYVTIFQGAAAELYPSNVHGVVLAKSGTGTNNIGIDQVEGGDNNYVYSVPTTASNVPFAIGYNACRDMHNAVAYNCGISFKSCSAMLTPLSTQAIDYSFDEGSIDSIAYVHGAGEAMYTGTVIFRADLIDLDGQGRGFKILDTAAPAEKADWSDQKTLSEKYLLNKFSEGKEQLSIAQSKQEMDTRTLVDSDGNYPITTYGGSDGKMHYHSIYTAQPAGFPSAVTNKQVLIVPKTNSNSNKEWFFAFHEDYLSVATRFDKSMLGVNELFWDMDGIEYRTCGDGKSPNAGCVFQYNGMSVPIGSDVNKNNSLAVDTSPNPFLDWAHVVSSDKTMVRGHLYSSGSLVTFTADTTSNYFVLPANVGHGTTSIKWYEVMFIDTKVNTNPDGQSPYLMSEATQKALFMLAVNSQTEYGTQLSIDLTK